MQINFSEDQNQQKLEASISSNPNHSMASQQGQVQLYNSKYGESQIELSQSKTQSKSIREINPFDYHVHGVVVQVNQEDLNFLKQYKTELLEKQLKLNPDNYNELLSMIPNDNKTVYANSLMDIQQRSVQDNIVKWTYYKQKQFISDNFKYIRYFYFKSTESYLHPNSPQDFKGQIVKYKNQITVLIGILEQVIDQPIMYQNIFKKFLQLFENFQQSEQSSSQTGLTTSQQNENLKNIIKMLYHQRLIDKNSFEINQAFYRYLNSSEVPSNVLLQFIRYQFKKEQIEYQSENMYILEKILNVTIQTCEESFNSQIQIKKGDGLIINIVYEKLSFNNLNVFNCYLLYNKPFLRDEKQDDEVLNLECGSCQKSNLNSIQYVIERTQKGKRSRYCYNCYKHFEKSK